MRDNDDGWWIKPTVKAVIGLAILFVIWFVEFVINPYGNTSVVLPGGHTGLIKGVYCDNAWQPWRFQATNQTGRANKRNWIVVNVWIDNDGVKTRPSQGTLTEKYEFSVPKCENELVDVAKIWSISTSSQEIHFRVHPQFTIQDTDAQTKISGYLTGSQLLFSFLTSLLVGITLAGPFFLGLCLYDLFDKVVDRYVLTHTDIPHLGHVRIALLFGALLFFAWPPISHWLISLDPFWAEDWYSQYVPALEQTGVVNISWSIWACISLIVGYLVEIGVDQIYKRIKNRGKNQQS